MRLASVLFGTLFLVACGNAPEDEPSQKPSVAASSITGSPTGTPEEVCEAVGGVMERTGESVDEVCIVSYADAGKACTDSDQCMGSCLGQASVDAQPGTKSSGHCSSSDQTFGCYTFIEDGVVSGTGCFDQN